MDVRQVDPRDTRWETKYPSYRVYFWKPRAEPQDAAQHVVACKSDEYEICGALDVREVLAWAEAMAGGKRTYTLYVLGT